MKMTLKNLIVVPMLILLAIVLSALIAYWVVDNLPCGYRCSIEAMILSGVGVLVGGTVGLSMFFLKLYFAEPGDEEPKHRPIK
jgi:hypothetical protein